MQEEDDLAARLSSDEDESRQTADTAVAATATGRELDLSAEVVHRSRQQQEDAGEIGRAYRSRALSLHPDKQRDASEGLSTSFHHLLAAYDVLSDATRRQLYDQQRRAAELSASSAARAQLWTEVTWTEMEYSSIAPPKQHVVAEEAGEGDSDEQQGQYVYVCKCGYRYIVSESHMDRLLDEQDEAVADIRLSCEWCSLGVHITADDR